MKKANFYVLSRRNGEICAELRSGWYDGKFFYYRSCGGTWIVIHPACGLSVCTGGTRKEAAETANTPQMAERIAESWARNGETLVARLEYHINKMVG